MKKQPLRDALAAATLTGMLSISTTVGAENWADRIRLNGFGSSVFQFTDNETYYSGAGNEAGINDDGSALGTKLGLNLSTNITERLMVASQLFGTASEGYLVHVDWAFAAFKLTDKLSLKAGKVKYPVGLINEYRDVGFAYPWLHAPNTIYSEQSSESPSASTRTAPTVTRESYDGFSLLWNQSIGDWTWDLNLFGGSVALDSATVKKLRGFTVNLDWQDTIQFTASSYVGVMRNPGSMMNGNDHAVALIGVKADWNNFIVYTEMAQVEMESMKAMSNTTGYITLGYRFGKFLPYYLLESFVNDAVAGSGEETEYTHHTVGLRYDLMKNTALKMDLSMLDHKKGAGLFETNPSGSGDVMKFGIGVDYVF